MLRIMMVLSFGLGNSLMNAALFIHDGAIYQGVVSGFCVVLFTWALLAMLSFCLQTQRRVI